MCGSSSFSLRCWDEKVTPVSLKLRCPINTRNVREIIRKAEKGLVRERIRTVNNRIDDLKCYKEEYSRHFETLVPDNVYTDLVHVINRKQHACADQGASY